MRRLIALASIAVLALAACGTTAAPTPASTRSATPAARSAEPTPAAPPGDATVDVEVSFDGTACVYEGPMAVSDGTKLRFEYLPTAAVADSSKAVVLAARPGTTWDEIIKSTPRGAPTVAPPWMVLPVWVVNQGQTSIMTLRSFYEEPIGGYYVGCTLDDVPSHAALVDVVE